MTTTIFQSTDLRRATPQVISNNRGNDVLSQLTGRRPRSQRDNDDDERLLRLAQDAEQSVSGTKNAKNEAAVEERTGQSVLRRVIAIYCVVLRCSRAVTRDAFAAAAASVEPEYYCGQCNFF